MIIPNPKQVTIIMAVTILLSVMATILYSSELKTIYKNTDKTLTMHLYKKNGEYIVKALSVRNAKFDYLENNESFKGLHYGRIVSYKGKTLGYSRTTDMAIIVCWDDFNPKAEIRGGCEELSEGDIILQMPFFPDGKYAELFDSDEQKILTIDLIKSKYVPDSYFLLPR